MIKVYTGFKGFAASLFFIGAMIIFLSIFFWGVTKAIQLVLPLLMGLSYLLIFVFLFGVLPSTFLKRLQPSLVVYTTLMSQALGVLTWMMSFFFVIKFFGYGGLFFVFLAPLLAPLALIGAMLKSSWNIAGHLSVWIGFSYVMKFYSHWLLNINSPKQEKSRIIEVDAIDVRGSSAGDS
jgi:hypothetical protein